MTAKLCDLATHALGGSLRPRHSAGMARLKVSIVLDSGARIEEEVVVTDKGCKVISLFPAEDLPISHRY